MQYIKGLENYQNGHPSVLTIGKFDGLHLGHEQLLKRVVRIGKEQNLDSVMLTFDMSEFYQDHQIRQQNLMSSDERIRRLQGRVDYLVECPLSRKMADMEPEQFIRQVLKDIFHAAYLVVGDDFTFGHEKRGDVSLLKDLSEKYGYQVEVLEKIRYQDRQISSTYVREALQAKDYELAEKLLGYCYEKKF